MIRNDKTKGKKETDTRTTPAQAVSGGEASVAVPTPSVVRHGAVQSLLAN